MKKVLRTHCSHCGTKLIWVIRHSRWYGLVRKALHCPYCKAIFVKNLRGEIDPEQLAYFFAVAAFIIGLILILKNLFGCTPY